MMNEQTITLDELWCSLDEHQWDGSFPISIWDDPESIFMDEDEVRIHIEDAFGDDVTEDQVASVKFCPMEEMEPPEFDMEDFLVDTLPEKCRLNCDEINKQVNEWIRRNFPKLYRPVMARIGAKQILGLLQ